MLTASDIQKRLAAVGDWLYENDQSVRILVVGGAALLLRGDADRLTTDDVDVIAQVEGGVLSFPDPLPSALAEAAAVVARSYDLPEDWLNAVVARGWRHAWPDGLPSHLLTDVEWKEYGGLAVGLAGRSVLIPLKLHAIVDQARAASFDADGNVSEVDLSPAEARRHLRDLLALAPTDPELDEAEEWVLTQDGSPHIPAFLYAIRAHVRRHRR